MNAFTHAIEAYTSNRSTFFSDAMAEKAIKLTSKYIVPAYEANEMAIKKLQEASALAGIAFFNAGLGLYHAISHKLGNVFGDFMISYGCANAILLLWVIKYNSQDMTVCKKYAEMLYLDGKYERK